MAQVFAVMHLYIYRDVVFGFFNCFFVLLLLSVPFLIRFLKSGMDELTEWSIIPACPSFMCFFFSFFNRGCIHNYINLCQD